MRALRGCRGGNGAGRRADGLVRIRYVRAALLSFVVCLSVSASGQPIIGPEITSVPTASIFHPNIAIPAVAMAKDQKGVAIAWSEPNGDGHATIRVARLDLGGHAVGAIREMPRFSPSDDALAPTIAPLPSGRGFTVAWLEHASAVYAQLDADLNASTPATIGGPFFVDVTPVIVRSGKETWITTQGHVWVLDDNGSIRAEYDAGGPASDMSATSDFPQLVSSQRKLTLDTTACGCARLGAGPFRGLCTCPVFRPTYALQFVSLFSATQSIPFDFDSTLQPAVLNDSREITIAWFRGSELRGGDVVLTHVDPAALSSFNSPPQSIGTFAPDFGMTRPGIATDGDHTLVVWRNASPHVARDIVGALIDGDGKVAPLSIATSPDDDEIDPSVIAIEPGLFLVAYEKISVSDRRIAGRFVIIPPGRRHAAAPR